MKLKKYLANAGIKQAAFAKKLGVSPGAVWQWINAYSKVDATNVLKIERATGGVVTRHELRPDLYPKEDAVA
jgi:DNA-binding transcriptional regulator YdaS (Cro superfamily)